MFLNVAAARQSNGWSSLRSYRIPFKPGVALSYRSCLHSHIRLLHESNRLRNSGSPQEPEAIVTKSKQSADKGLGGHVPSKEFIENLEQYKKYCLFPFSPPDV